MLKEMPKVGDVLIAQKDDQGRGGIGALTKGKGYTIVNVRGSLHTWFHDNDGISRIICEDRFSAFKLKGEVPPVGHIEINREYDFLIGKTRLVLDVDEAGLAAVKALVERSGVDKYKAEITDKIAQCQAEMDQLKSLLAEVSE